MADLMGGLTILLIFIGLSTPIIVIGMVYFFKKKLDHKTLVAAIEKGVPVSELNLSLPKKKKNDGPGWVQDQSKGITLLVIGIGIGAVLLPIFGPITENYTIIGVFSIIPIVFLGNGIGLLIRSRQRRKYEKPEPVEEAEQITEG